MNYCSLEDAWGGKCNQINNQYSNYMVDKNYKNTQPENIDKSSENDKFLTKINSENFQNTHIKQKTLQKNIDHHLDELYDCDSFLIHIHNCRKCHNKMKNYFKPKIVENFQDIIEDNRDTIVLILIGISILLFFNLINNITK